MQRVDFDAPFEVAPLYYRLTNEHQISEPVTITSGGLRIPKSGSVSFDTYFNAFFENYWFGYTNLTSVTLRVHVEGSCIVRVMRQSPETDMYTLDTRNVSGNEVLEFVIDHDDELRVEAGRVFFEVEALSETTVIAASWETKDAPRRPVELAVVFCTFNRQQYLQRILRAIDSDTRAVKSVNRIFVINQGDKFSAEEILGPDTTGRLSEKLVIIEQPNMGGCGGFTRGIFETVNDDQLTHFLLMDDDSRVNPESIARSRDFLAHADDNVVLGGHMLNLHRPNRLFEAGAMLDQASLQPTAIHHNTDLADPHHGLEVFLRPGAVSYNGWWMFGAPASVIDDIGYPMPCFIRGDDMEFGLRVQNSGKQTIPVPGIAVWHEPFYLKLGGWQFFFEVRNRLAKASLHEHPNFAGIRKDLRRVFLRDIAMCRYHSCKMMIDAIRVYADGPDAALDTTDAPLQAARKVVAKYGPTQVDEVAFATSKAEDLRDRGELRKLINTAQTAVERRVGKVVLAGQVVRRVVVPERKANGTEPKIRARDLKPHAVANYDSYVVIEEHGGIAWRFQRDRALEQALWREFLGLVKLVEFDPRYLKQFETTDRFADSWRQTFSELESGATLA